MEHIQLTSPNLEKIYNTVLDIDDKLQLAPTSNGVHINARFESHLTGLPIGDALSFRQEALNYLKDTGAISKYYPELLNPITLYGGLFPAVEVHVNRDRFDVCKRKIIRAFKARYKGASSGVTRGHVAAAVHELSQVQFRWPSKGNATHLIVLYKKRSEKVTLERAERAVLHQLITEIRTKHGPKVSPAEHGQVSTEELQRVIRKNCSASEAGVESYLRKVISELRRKLTAAAKKLGVNVAARYVVEYKPFRTREGGFYRLSIPARNLLT